MRWLPWILHYLKSKKKIRIRFFKLQWAWASLDPKSVLKCQADKNSIFISSSKYVITEGSYSKENQSSINYKTYLQILMSVQYRVLFTFTRKCIICIKPYKTSAMKEINKCILWDYLWSSLTYSEKKIRAFISQPRLNNCWWHALSKIQSQIWKRN